MAKVTVLTNLGEEWCAKRLAGVASVDGISGRFIGWGTGTGTAAKGDSTLFTEAAGTRAGGTASVVGTGAAAKYQVEGTLVALEDITITNAGNFTAQTSGVLIVHTSFDGIALNEDDQITFTFTIDPS